MEKEQEEESTLSFLGKCFLGAVGAVCAVAGALDVVGFKSGGVAPGSIASRWQSKIGNVQEDSFFASCQKAGASGMSEEMQTGLGIAGALATAAFLSKK